MQRCDGQSRTRAHAIPQEVPGRRVPTRELLQQFAGSPEHQQQKGYRQPGESRARQQHSQQGEDDGVAEILQFADQQVWQARFADEGQWSHQRDRCEHTKEKGGAERRLSFVAR